MTPHVSVVMPVRDAETYVAEAVKSILDQTLRDLELVVIDDGSTDGTAGIIRALAASDKRVRLHAGRGGGLVAALNEGCALATAPLLARMDADDVAEPTRLARQVDAMDAEPELVLLGTALTQIDERGAAFATVSYPAVPGEELLERNCFAHPTVVFRRDAFEQVGGYRDLFPHAEDYDLWLRFAELGRVGNLSEPLLRYRVHQAQVTRRAIEEQARSTLVAQAAARARRAGEVEPKSSELAIDESTLSQRVLDAHVNLAALAIHGRRYNEAERLLDTADSLSAGVAVAIRRRIAMQRARLEWRRRRPLRLARLAIRAALLARVGRLSR